MCGWVRVALSGGWRSWNEAEMMENHEYSQISLGIGAQLLMPQRLRCFHANLAVRLFSWAAGLVGMFGCAIFDR